MLLSLNENDYKNEVGVKSGNDQLHYNLIIAAAIVGAVQFLANGAVRARERVCYYELDFVLAIFRDYVSLMVKPRAIAFESVCNRKRLSSALTICVFCHPCAYVMPLRSIDEGCDDLEQNAHNAENVQCPYKRHHVATTALEAL